uniref:Uncharacterized protein n=1 Tax=Oryza brachyantha TaxID=4533 RepID=J3N8V5_ORYBR
PALRAADHRSAAIPILRHRHLGQQRAILLRHSNNLTAAIHRPHPNHAATVPRLHGHGRKDPTSSSISPGSPRRQPQVAAVGGGKMRMALRLEKAK